MSASQALHPTDATLHAYGLGRLDDASAESVSAHLEGCPDCRRRVAEVSSDSFLGRMRDAKPRPASSGPAISSTDGLSVLDGGAVPFAPPPIGTLPPGLAERTDYEVLRELGQGGMGTVFLAQNTLMGRMEVLKVVSGHLINRRGVLDRFQGEIRNAAKLHHSNIVTAYTAIRLGESLVLAMEYVEGLDLSKLVKTRGPLPVANACNYVHQAALGLQHAHEHGMVHRDIKPSNLMLSRQGNRALIKVLDFGLAKLKSEAPTDRSLTNEGQMLGTPDYIAPEQISDARRADIRADIYSLGCTFYYLLTGGPPFHGTSLYDILQAHHSMEAMPLNLARPEVPVEVAAVVAKMMAKEPGRRFQEPKEVAQALKPFFKSGHVAPVGSGSDISRARGCETQGETAGTGSMPMGTAKGPEAVAASPGRTPGQDSRSEPMWESLVDLKETVSPLDPVPAVASNRRTQWLWPSAAVGILLLALIAVWGTRVIKIKTPEGYIVLRVLPDGATVLVDGKKATVRWPDDGGPAEITVVPGEHFIVVKKDGSTLLGQKVTVEKDGRETLVVDLEPLEAPRQAEPEKIPRTVDSPAGGGAIANAPKTGADQPKHQFESLLNGVDKAGWEDLMPNGSEWKVVDHVLEGHHGGDNKHAVLATQREDFTNFCLRVKYRYQGEGGGNIEIRRSRQGENKSAYLIHHGLWPTADKWQVPVGSIAKVSNHVYGRFIDWVKAEPTPAPVDTWNTIEITVVANRITTLVNGTKVAEFTDGAGSVLPKFSGYRGGRGWPTQALLR